MNFYLAILLRAAAVLSVVLSSFALGALVSSSDGFWIAPSIFGWVLAYGLWRSAQHVMARHVGAQEVPF